MSALELALHVLLVAGIWLVACIAWSAGAILVVGVQLAIKDKREGR